MLTNINAPSKPVLKPVTGSPFQVGDRIKVISISDQTGIPELVGKKGRVKYLEFSCGCGQSYPHDPMIGVLFRGGKIEEFWKEEIRLEG